MPTGIAKRCSECGNIFYRSLRIHEVPESFFLLLCPTCYMRALLFPQHPPHQQPDSSDDKANDSQP